MPKAPLPQTIVRTRREPAAVTALAASPWAPLVAVAGQKQVLLYNTDTLDLLGVAAVPGRAGQRPASSAATAACSWPAAAAAASRARSSSGTWPTGERIIEVGDENDAVLAADISADQTQIALGGPGKIVRVYATADGKLLREIKKHTDWITAVEYSPDGVLLATGDRNGGLFVWEAHTGREFFGLRGHTAAITGLSWRDDSNVLASASEDTTVRLWEMENGKQIKSFGTQPGGALSVRYGHDNRIVTTGRDGVTRLWDENGEGQKAFEKLTDLATQAVFTHDGTRVIAGDMQGLLRVWNAADGKRIDDLSTNPPSKEERLLAAKKALPDAEKALVDKEAALAKAKTHYRFGSRRPRQRPSRNWPRCGKPRTTRPTSPR